jgi:hypothetical protein
MAPEETASSITLTGGPYSYGDTVTFDYTVEKLKGHQWPMVILAAFQDVDESGGVDTVTLGPDIVFAVMDKPEATFQLAGSSAWADRGGPAVARLDLMAYSKTGSITPLASSEEFPVKGP